MTEFNFLEILPQLFLLVAVVATLVHWPKVIAAGSMALALVAALPAGVLDFYSFLVCLVLPIFLFFWVNHYFADWLRKFGFLIFLLLGGALAFHQMPGLLNFKIFDRVVFSQASSPFDMYLNFDKVYVALCLFLLMPPLERVARLRQSKDLVAKYFLAAVLTLMPLALLSGQIGWDPKANPYILLWALNNFFFVCFSEEVIFRFFVQNHLVSFFRNVQYGDFIGIFAGALLFGLAHFSGGWVLVVLSVVAGLFYGVSFYHTCNVRVSMMVHFLVNLTHVILFTYPLSV